jgi:DNA-directed RNA polymerase specialized sigma24 family protein
VELAQYVAYATRVAKSLWKDPEAESIANAAAWRAYTTYREPATRYGNYTEEGWIALIVRQSIHQEWRRLGRQKRSNEHTDGWWLEVVSTTDDEVSEPVVSPEDWQLLCERFIDGWPVDVIARRHNEGVTHIRRRIAASLQRFTEGMKNR